MEREAGWLAVHLGSSKALEDSPCQVSQAKIFAKGAQASCYDTKASGQSVVSFKNDKNLIRRNWN